VRGRLPAGALGERNFRLLVSARAISFLGTNLAPIAVAFAVLDLTGSATDVGLAFAAWTLAQISTLVVGGVVADRFSRRRVMVVSDSANFVIRALMGVLLLAGTMDVWVLVALQAFGGAATAFYSPASSGLVPETVPARFLQEANGYMSVSRYLAFPLGAAIGGTIVATVGAGWALVFDAATYGTSAVLLSAMRLAAQVRRGSSPRFFQQLREGWETFTEHIWVWLTTGWISLYFLITYAPFFILGPYVSKTEFGGAGSWAAIVTGEGLGALLGGLVALRVRPGRSLVVIGVFFTVTAVQSVLLAVQAPVGAIAVAAALAGAAFSFGTVVWETTLQERIPRERLSRVSAYNWMGAMLFLPAGYAIAGPVAMAIGVSTTLWIGAAWIVVSTIALLTVADVRNFRADSAGREVLVGA
jgi:predicted MFS family arabinose efflux permease